MPLETSRHRSASNQKAALFLSAFTIALLSIAGLIAGWNNRDLFLPGKDLDEIRKSGKLKVLISYDPINYFIYKGAPMGYSYELAERFAGELGVRLEVVPVRNLDRQIPMLRNDEGDLIAHPVTIIGDRTATVNFSKPIDSTCQVLIQKGVPDGSTSRLVRHPRELDGKTVHVREKSAYHHSLLDIVRRYGISMQIVPVHGSLSTGELIGRVSDGNIAFTVADSNIAVPHQAIYQDIDISTVISRRQPLAWAVRKNSPMLHQALNAWFDREKRSGLLPVLHSKYYNQQNRIARHAFQKFYSDKAGSISPYDELVKSGANTIGWDWRLLSSLIYEESQFDPQIVSWSGAMGLMQIMPATAAFTRVSNLSDPASNIRAGTIVIGVLDREWKEIADPETRLRFILASYNVGAGHVRDAQKLAAKYGADPKRWENHVERFLALKSDPRYYNDAAADFGYCNGSLPVRYTRNILNRYQLYRQVIPK